MSEDQQDFEEPEDDYVIHEQPPHSVTSYSSEEEKPIIISGKPYQSIPFRDVFLLIDRNIKILSRLFYCSRDWALVFYENCDWDLQRCKSTFFDFNQKLALESGFNDRPQQFVQTQEQCQVCEMIHYVMFQLNCRHRICQPCSQSYITFNVNRQNTYFTCSHQGCNVPYLRSTIEQFIKGNSILEETYVRAITKKFIQANKTQFVECLATGCPMVVHRADLSLKDVKCQCGLKFCYDCRQPCHYPSSCEQVQEWVMCVTNDPTSMYLKKTTRICPNCKWLICRVGGCNLMTCKCLTKFCFVCGNQWANKHVYPYMCPFSTELKQNMARDRKIFEIINKFYGLFAENDYKLKRIYEVAKLISLRRDILFDALKIDYLDTTFLEQVYTQAKQLVMMLKWSYPLSHFCNKQSTKSDIYLNQQKSAQQKCHKAVESLVQWTEQFFQSLIPTKVYNEYLCEDVTVPIDYVERANAFRIWREEIRKDIKAAQVFIQALINIARQDLKYDSINKY